MKKPYLVLEWSDIESDAIGWVCIYNTVKGHTGGGIRMHPSVTEEEVIRLATVMGWKYEAGKSGMTGGCKGGIRYDYKAPDAEAVLERFLVAIMPVIDKGVSLGGDLGVSYATTRKIFTKYNREIPLTKTMKTKPEIVENMRRYSGMLDSAYDQFTLGNVITGYGVAYTADEAWKFNNPTKKGRVMIQGFGAVGTSCAKKLVEYGYTVVGISDANICVECQDGLDIDTLLKTRNAKFGELNKDHFKDNYIVRKNTEWLDVDCDILIPAALEDVINKNNADKVTASLIVEAANICTTPEADVILKKKGVNIGVDFLSNLGAIRAYDAVIFGILKNPTNQDVLDDIETICRGNIKELFTIAKKQNRYHREVAMEIFAPKTYDPFEI